MEIDHYGVSVVWVGGVLKAKVSGYRKLCNLLKEKVVFAETKQVETHPHPNHLSTTPNVYTYK